MSRVHISSSYVKCFGGGGVEWDCEFAQNQKIPDASATDALGQVPTSFTMFKITLVGINLPPCQ